MKRFILSIFSSALLLSNTMSALPADPQQKEIIDAVMAVYDDELRTDPTNYEVWFRRANLFYGNDQYSRALSDIDNAIKYTPATDSDLLAQEYSLRANIYIMLDRYADALPDLAEALKHDPASYATIYQKANVELQLGKYQEAKDDYRKLGRMQNRSLESLIGLSQVAIRENNFGLANEYIDRAVNLFPNEPDIYLRRADIRNQLGNNVGAVEDMIMALSLDSRSTRAIRSITSMANRDYNSVISGLSRAITQAPDNGMFYYIRASIEQAHYHYVAAINDFNTIIERNLYNYAGLYASLAECYYHLCNFPEALDNINYAIGSGGAEADYYVILSKVRLAMGDNEAALAAAERAIETEGNAPSIQSLKQKAECMVAYGKYAEASALYGEAIVENPESPSNYIIRAWIMINHQNKKGDAMTFLRRAVDLDFDASDINSLKGFALILLGNDSDAYKWITEIMAANPVDVDGHINYLASCLYSRLGDDEKALDCMTRSLDKGYGNLYDWTVDSTANINVAPLRENPEFAPLLKSYDYLFK